MKTRRKWSGTFNLLRGKSNNNNKLEVCILQNYVLEVKENKYLLTNKNREFVARKI